VSIIQYKKLVSKINSRDRLFFLMPSNVIVYRLFPLSNDVGIRFVSIILDCAFSHIHLLLPWTRSFVSIINSIQKLLVPIIINHPTQYAICAPLLHNGIIVSCWLWMCLSMNCLGDYNDAGTYPGQRRGEGWVVFF